MGIFGSPLCDPPASQAMVVNQIEYAKAQTEEKLQRYLDSRFDTVQAVVEGNAVRAAREAVARNLTELITEHFSEPINLKIEQSVKTEVQNRMTYELRDIIRTEVKAALYDAMTEGLRIQSLLEEDAEPTDPPESWIVEEEIHGEYGKVLWDYYDTFNAAWKGCVESYGTVANYPPYTESSEPFVMEDEDGLHKLRIRKVSV